jgi:citrate synthase
MKKSSALYLSAREAAAELAISPATLYAYVSRGLIRSEPSSDSRSHRYRAEDIRGLKERRTPSPEPRGLKSFDADLPVMDSAIATITEDGPIYRGVSCIELAEADTLEHAATLLWDVAGVDPTIVRLCPAKCARSPTPPAMPPRSTAPSPCWRWLQAPIRGRSPAPPTGARWSAAASCVW